MADKLRTLKDCVRRLEAAVGREDWAAAATADSELAAAIADFGDEALDTLQRRTLDAAATVHAAARERCRNALADVVARLDAMRANREGWIAYALDGEAREAGQ